jgi:hypothetical protein
MTEDGEWNRKGATLSDATALKEYGVATAFITKGIRAGDLEYREGTIWGNPYIRLLRSQLETYIAKERGSDYLATANAKTELRAITKEMREIDQRLAVLQARKATIEQLLHRSQ